MEDKIKEVLGELGRVLDNGKREDIFWFDVDTTPLTKDKYGEIEKKFFDEGLAVKIINAGAHLSKKAVKEIQRIWLVAFAKEPELKKWLADFEEKKKRDHRFIGEQLDWFHVQEDLVGSGLPLLHPKGMIIRRGLIDLMREVNSKLEVQEVWAPHFAKADLWKMSGHYDHYRDKMFVWKQDDQEWGLKAMNCPLHIQIYRHKPKSYKDMPVRYGEFATDYRKEQSGELHGLSRVWSLTQDDRHFFVNPNQITEEITKILRAAQDVYGLFGFPYKIKLATKPEKAMGDAKLWDKAEQGLKDALGAAGVEYELEEGDGAFYGPKIDIYVKDNMARWWQLTTIQLDFFMPENFKLSYVDKSGENRQPIMIHFAILGSIERFMSVIIEHTGGRLPLWLAPIQVKVLPVGKDHEGYAQVIVDDLRQAGIRAESENDGTLNKRIRSSEVEKAGLIVVVGEREKLAGEINVRGKGNLPILEFKEKLMIAEMEKKEFE